MNFTNEDMVLARYEDAKEEILPKLEEIVKNRDDLKAKLGALEAQVEDLKGKRGGLEGEVEALKTRSLEAGKAGGNALKEAKALAGLRGEQELIDGLLEALRADIEQTKAQLRAAVEAVYDEWLRAQALYRKEAQEGFNELHTHLSQLHASYLPGLRRLYEEVMRPGDFRDFPLKHPRGVDPKPCAPLYVSRERSIYVLNDRREMPSVGSAVLR